MSVIDIERHGHVRPNANGMKARCGGPARCPVCQEEQRLEAGMHETQKWDIPVGTPKMKGKGMNELKPPSSINGSIRHFKLNAVTRLTRGSK